MLLNHLSISLPQILLEQVLSGISEPHESLNININNIDSPLLRIDHQINPIIQNSTLSEDVSQGSWNPLLKENIFGEVLSGILEVFIAVEELELITLAILDGIVYLIEDLLEGMVDLMNSVCISDHFLDYYWTPSGDLAQVLFYQLFKGCFVFADKQIMSIFEEI